jgi:hypothetical protein
MHRNGG